VRIAETNGTTLASARDEMLNLDPIADKVSAYNKQADVELLRRAYEFGERAHSGQVRKSGEPYFAHPIEVANIIADLRLDVPSICAAFLHDTVEDTDVSVDDIERMFGREVAGIVDGVTKLSKLEFSNKEQRQAENFRKMIVAMAKDIRVLLVKLADRTHNMRTLEHMAPHKQELIAQETIDIYAPLANRLGIQWMKVELEDLSFRYLNPESYRTIADKLAKTRAEREQFIEETLDILRRELVTFQLEGDVYGRPKHIYSIYKKMRDREIEFEQLHDLLAFRILVSTLPQCYAALGIVHNLWKPIPDRFKDYIAVPKANMYQSLHTAVVGHKGERIEVQIRTQEMHRVAENGIAAHWVYKEGRVAPQSGDQQKFAWLRQLMEWQTELTDATEFLETVKVDLFSDEVYVFTPRGMVVALPQDASPVDFAFAIHTAVGERCTGAKVNGRIVPLRHALKNGDTIEILTSPHQRPSKDWLKFVKTSRARAKIRHAVRMEERVRARELGLELLDKELRRYDLSYSKLTKKGHLSDDTLRALRVQTSEELLLEIGYGKVEAEQAIEKLVPAERRAEVRPKEAPKESFLGQLLRKVVTRQPPATPGAKSKTGIRVAGVDDVLVRFGRCCAPVPGDDIIGFITRGRGITVHAKNCQKGLDTDPARRIEVEWEAGSQCKRTVAVKVITTDRPGLLAQMSQVFTENGINISQANCRTTDDNRAVNTFDVTITDLTQLKRAMRHIEQITGVVSVERVGV
jgi:GTP pyrophosphokinase